MSTSLVERLGYQVIVVASHRRSGTHWTIDTIRNNFADVSMRFLTFEDIVNKEEMSLRKFQKLIAGNSKLVIVKMHLDADFRSITDDKTRSYVEQLVQGSRVIYVYRDGRDVMASLYNYMQIFSPEVQDMSFSAFIRSPATYDVTGTMNCIAYWKDHVNGWFEKDALQIDYRSLQNDYVSSVYQLGAYLNLGNPAGIKEIPLTTPRNRDLMSRIRSRLLRTTYGQSSSVAPRKGKTGDWRNYFSDQDLSFFNDIAGDLLEALNCN
jgi:hypothetical protein